MLLWPSIPLVDLISPIRRILGKGYYEVVFKNFQSGLVSAFPPETTVGFYPIKVYATQDVMKLDQDRIECYKKLMANGSRPFGIALNDHLIDEHHKAKAYEGMDIQTGL